jgi:hypothetical protein
MLADYEREPTQKKDGRGRIVINDIPAPVALMLLILALNLGGAYSSGAP